VDPPPNATIPWLANISDTRTGHMTNSPDNHTLPSLTPSQSQGSVSGRGSRSSASMSASRPPSLRKDQSSSGSMSSIGSYSTPRTPSDASLPIHALLSSKPEPAYVVPQQQIPPLSMPPSQAPLVQLQHHSSRPPNGNPGPGRLPQSNGTAWFFSS
jgi:hypothetical protein